MTDSDLYYVTLAAYGKTEIREIIATSAEDARKAVERSVPNWYQPTTTDDVTSWPIRVYQVGHAMRAKDALAVLRLTEIDTGKDSGRLSLVYLIETGRLPTSDDLRRTGSRGIMMGSTLPKL